MTINAFIGLISVGRSESLKRVYLYRNYYGNILPIYVHILLLYDVYDIMYTHRII